VHDGERGSQCAPSRCTGRSTGIGPSSCSAEGASCPANGTTFDCGAYACDDAFGACRTVCTQTSDCADGHVCDGASERCVVSSTSGGSGGCGVAHAPPPRRASSIVASLVLVAMARLRRRQRAPAKRSTASFASRKPTCIASR
jgi:MYXO-CTERM domain-containing protein